MPVAHMKRASEPFIPLPIMYVRRSPDPPPLPTSWLPAISCAAIPGRSEQLWWDEQTGMRRQCCSRSATGESGYPLRNVTPKFRTSVAAVSGTFTKSPPLARNVRPETKVSSSVSATTR